jgi:agmatine/peptidylarginine deiminase
LPRTTHPAPSGAFNRGFQVGLFGYTRAAMSHRQLPAEWAPQSAVMLTWPHAHGDWGDSLPAVEECFLAMADAIACRQRLIISCYDAAARESLRARLRMRGTLLGRVALHIVPSNDVFARDHGPITVLDGGQQRLLHFRFDAWGGKYDSSLDACITRQLHEQQAFGGLPLEAVDFVLEGGSIESDGAGTLLTTESCLLRHNRNPGLDRIGIETALRRHLGVQRILWLTEGGIPGDDTDGHVDTLARFSDDHSIVFQGGAGPLTAMRGELAALRTVAGVPYRLWELPAPAPKLSPDGAPLPATYANFLIINGAVLAPVYDDPADAAALEVLRQAFPGRAILPIPALPLIGQYGSVHCASMQIPAAP